MHTILIASYLALLAMCQGSALQYRLGQNHKRCLDKDLQAFLSKSWQTIFSKGIFLC